MTLSKQYFQDFPIEFKQINPEDFPNFEVDEKVGISPNEQGYINDALQENINIDKKNTLVINAAVGQGKTYSIIQIIKRYFEADKDYVIFVAAPYTSLVQQYCHKIHEAGIPQEEIYSYNYIGNETHIDAWDCHIQVLTVNALLGNPGDDAFINTEEKRNYLNYLVRKCEQYCRKAVFVYDEIHDAIHNFKEELIFNHLEMEECNSKKHLA
ncbi:DEAD/DEAH box helicase family protein [Sinomicrobium oceani]|uniref:DEAD/DEAH box helicase family protein n=1 Tax=Sinomicrobium oceani TaxID=1150368 RepID=UPI00227A2004|nr:DEAD/DEAH box helicase family protein [Sinomicrobium oceani]